MLKADVAKRGESSAPRVYIFGEMKPIRTHLHGAGLALLGLLPGTAAAAVNSNDILFTLGPEISFGGGEGCCRVGLEFGVWGVHGLAYGWDLGISTYRGRHLAWSELQAGVAVAGVSAGAVHDFSTGTWGPQCTAWGGLLALVGFRYRKLGSQSTYTGLLQAKLPWSPDDAFPPDDPALEGLFPQDD